MGGAKFKHTFVIRYSFRRYKMTDDIFHHTVEAPHKGRRESVFSHEGRASRCSQDKYYCETRRYRFVSAARLAIDNDMEGPEAVSGTDTVKMRRVLVGKL